MPRAVPAMVVPGGAGWGCPVPSREGGYPAYTYSARIGALNTAALMPERPLSVIDVLKLRQVPQIHCLRILNFGQLRCAFVS